MTAEGRNTLRHNALVFFAAASCLLASLLVPDWQARLHAQGYGPLSLSIVSQALEDVTRERELLSARAEQATETSPVRQLASASLLGVLPATPTPRWGAFLAFDRDTIRRSREDEFNGFDEKIPGMLGGLDYRLSPQLLIGGAMALKLSEKSFAGVPPDNPSEVGSQRIFTALGGPYLSYTPTQHWYGTLTLLAGHLDVRTRRFGAFPLDGATERLTDVARGDTDGHTISVAAGGGYEWQYRALGFGPMLDVAYDRVHINGFTERGRNKNQLLVLDGDTEDSITVRAGPRGYFVQRFAWGAMIPNWRLLYVYRDSFEDGSATLSFLKSRHPPLVFPRTPPDPASLDLGVGLQIVLPSDLTFWVDYQENFLEDFLKRTHLTVGIRKQF